MVKKKKIVNNTTGVKLNVKFGFMEQIKIDTSRKLVDDLLAEFKKCHLKENKAFNQVDRFNELVAYIRDYDDKILKQHLTDLEQYAKILTTFVKYPYTCIKEYGQSSRKH